MKAYLNPWIWLSTGLLLMVGTHMTYSVGAFAWIAYAPFLIYLHQTRGWKSRLWFFLLYVLAWSLIVFKIVTAPIPLFVIPLYSIPIALFHLPAFLLWSRFYREKGAVLLFPALAVILEWVQYTFTPFGSWGAAAYSQMDHLILMQSVSLFGLAGLGFLIYWINASLASLYITGDFGIKKWMPALAVFLLVYTFGALRYDFSKAQGQEMIRVAAVGTDAEIGAGPLPSHAERQRNASILFDRTRKAARLQPELIVWNEAAAGVLPEEESQWKASLVSLAVKNEIHLVASYVVLLSESPIQYENKYLFILPDGTIAETYFKHEPVPGEPAVKGTAAFQGHTIDEVTIAGAICYDYDFPYIAKAHGRLKADLIALPSSDWRGIDPIHTKMAAFRAVEQGFSILRSTRFGLSSAVTPFGEMTAQLSSFDQHDRVMLAFLPEKRAFTLYSLIGDVFVYLWMGLVTGFLVRQLIIHQNSFFWSQSNKPYVK